MVIILIMALSRLPTIQKSVRASGRLPAVCPVTIHDGCNTHDDDEHDDDHDDEHGDDHGWNS